VQVVVALEQAAVVAGDKKLHGEREKGQWRDVRLPG